MFRLIITVLMLGFGVTSALAQPVPCDTDNWQRADAVVLGTITKTTLLPVGKTDPPYWNVSVEIDADKILRGPSVLGKQLTVRYAVKQDNAPSFPKADSQCLIGLVNLREGLALQSVDVATKEVIEKAREATRVTKPIKLFNGTDLTNFYTWLGMPYRSADEKFKKKVLPFGKNKDPLKVFSVVDNSIRVSGEVFGCFTTEKEYENYHLVAEFKWGQKTWPPREKATMDSGILLHCVGEDGAAGGSWMESIECQMIEGGTGDFILVGGKGRPKITAVVKQIGKQSYYDPKGDAKEFDSGRINWFGRDPDWKDVKGFRGKNDVEKQAGEWNKLECVCDGDKITIILNDTVVNVGTNASHTKGKILFQSEGAEVFFRRIELLPLKK